VTENLYKRKITRVAEIEKIKENKSVKQVSKQVKVELPVLFTKTESVETMIGTRVRSYISGSSIAQLSTLVHKTQLKILDVAWLTSSIKNDIHSEWSPLVD
jgi:hypothetical protein